MKRIAFIFEHDEEWLGGLNYFRNLISAIDALPDREIEAVIFVGSYMSEQQLADLPRTEIVRSNMIRRYSFPWLIRRLLRYVFSRDILLERLLIKHNVDVMSHSGSLGRGSRVPSIGWIPDFQHLRLPEFFSEEKIAALNKLFSHMCQNCTTIIVSSFDAQADLKRFDQNCASKSEVLQFVVPSLKAGIMVPGHEELEARYKFSGNYFLLPNQFWKHKNHRIAIEALGLLRREGKRLLILATGNKADYRHPEYFNSVMERAKELDVLDSFSHLGLVPSSDLAGLMRGALAIINPSFFEGWSTTVEEARSLGKRVLLSDIPVHREQDPPLAGYFPPDDAKALAALLWEIWNKPDANEMKIFESAQRATEERRLEFAKRYQRIVLRTAENTK